MSFWIAAIFLSAVTLFLLAAPIWRKDKEEAERADFDLSVFKDQLKELEKEKERGLISGEEAEQAKIEIQRRMLAADDKRRGLETGARVTTKTYILVGLVGAITIVGSFLMYNYYGMPGYGDVPFASRNIEKERNVANNDEGMASEIAALKKRLDQNPKDVDSWVLLGRTLRTVGRNDEAMDAFRNAVKESNRHPAVLADYAEAKIYANQGAVDKETVGALLEALQGDPLQFKARFYFGYAKARKEDFEGAMQAWTDLIAMAPPQAPWLKQVREQIKMASRASGLDPADFKPSEKASVMGKKLRLEWEVEKADQSAQPAQPGPSAEQMQQAAEMSQEEREEMIRGMVQRLADRLKDEPNDLEGWKRLAQVYMVLGEKEKAIEAQNKVKELSN